MSPTNYFACGYEVDSKELGYFVSAHTRSRQASDCQNLFVRQFSVIVTLSMRVPTLAKGIVRIVAAGSQKQMRKIHTPLIIAAMTNKLLSRFPSRKQQPCNTMRWLMPGMSHAEFSIATPVNGAGPVHATIVVRWGAILRKTLGNIHGYSVAMEASCC